MIGNGRLLFGHHVIGCALTMSHHFLPVRAVDPGGEYIFEGKTETMQGKWKKIVILL